MGIGVDITVEQEGNVYVVVLDGRLDASTTPVVEKKLASLLEKADKLIIDFDKVSYLSSAGMRLMLSATKKMQAKQGNVAFINLSDMVMDIVKMAGFERILNIFLSKKDALEFLG